MSAKFKVDTERPNALITGASRGIGRAIAEALAADGYDLSLTCRNSIGELETFAAYLSEEYGISVCAERVDMKISADVRELFEGITDLDVLVNNAGIRRDNSMFMLSDDEWHQVIDTTLDGFFYVTRRLLKHMMPRRRGGRIVNIASLSGVKGIAGQTNYSAAKAALIGATKALALEVAARNITVNAVAPGFIATDMTSSLPVDELTKLIPVGRFGQPEEVAALVAFLVSDEAAYITGQVVNINGGLYT